MLDQQSSMLDQIRRAFARGDEEVGHELIAEAIERLEMPAEVVAAAMGEGLEAWRPAEIAPR